MTIDIKSKNEIAKMRASGRIAAKVREKLAEMASRPGTNAMDLEKEAERMIAQQNAKPAFKNHGGYEFATCISLNDEIVHGLPYEEKIFEKGDLVGIDVGVLLDGYYSDTATTVIVAEGNEKTKKLLEVTKKSLDEAILTIKPGKRLGDIQSLIQTIIEKEGFGVIRDLSGHGIGKNLQEPPSIPNFGKAGTGPILKEGMTFAIEPMVSMGGWQIKIADDGWTVKMADGSLGAHFEHTIAVTKNGAEVLTR